MRSVEFNSFLGMGDDDEEASGEVALNLRSLMTRALSLARSVSP